MSSFKDYVPDSDKTSKGVKLVLFDRSGKVSNDYVLVRWAYDDTVKAAKDNLSREISKSLVHIRPDTKPADAKAIEAKNKEITDTLVREAQIAQVAGWSFAEKATKANVRSFLKSRPDVADRIDIVSADTKLFFTDSGASS